MKYRVFDEITKEDITDKYCWVIRPNGELAYNEYGDLIGYSNATYLEIGREYSSLEWLPMHYFDEHYGRIYKCPYCGHERIGTAKYCDECGKQPKV